MRGSERQGTKANEIGTSDRVEPDWAGSGRAWLGTSVGFWD